MNKLVTIIVAITTLIINGNDGQLDDSFGTNGKLTINFGGNDQAFDVIVQPDRKIVVVGPSDSGGTINFMLVRLNENSSFDTTFNTNGLVTTNFGGTLDEPNALALQTDGKIVVVGVSNASGGNEFALARYNHNGSLDASFGIVGLVRTSFGGTGQDADAVIIQPDNKIIAGGTAEASGTFNFALARYLSNGSLDPSFGTGGLVTTDFSGDADAIEALLLQPDDKIVALGFATITGGIDFALARYNPDGSLDSSFGMTGTVTTNFGGTSDTAMAGVLQPDGKIIAAGFTNMSGSFDFALARYNPDGSLDTTFGVGGLVITNFGGTLERIDAVVLQTDGKIVAVGRSNTSGSNDFALARYTTNGLLDTSFGVNGLVLTSFGGFFDESFGGVMQSDGKIIAVGRSDASITNDFALARYLIPSIIISPEAVNFRAKYFLLQ